MRSHAASTQQGPAYIAQTSWGGKNLPDVKKYKATIKIDTVYSAFFDGIPKDDKSVASHENDEARVVFDGPRTIRTSAATLSELLRMTRNTSAVQIDCQAIEEVDLTFVQLLLAARNSATKAGKEFKLVHPLSEALMDALERGGFLTDQASDKAFWLQPVRV